MPWIFVHFFSQKRLKLTRLTSEIPPLSVFSVSRDLSSSIEIHVLTVEEPYLTGNQRKIDWIKGHTDFANFWFMSAIFYYYHESSIGLFHILKKIETWISMSFSFLIMIFDLLTDRLEGPIPSAQLPAALFDPTFAPPISGPRRICQDTGVMFHENVIPRNTFRPPRKFSPVSWFDWVG